MMERTISIVIPGAVTAIVVGLSLAISLTDKSGWAVAGVVLVLAWLLSECHFRLVPKDEMRRLISLVGLILLLPLSLKYSLLLGCFDGDESCRELMIYPLIFGLTLVFLGDLLPKSKTYGVGKNPDREALNFKILSVTLSGQRAARFNRIKRGEAQKYYRFAGTWLFLLGLCYIGASFFSSSTLAALELVSVAAIFTFALIIYRGYQYRQAITDQIDSMWRQ